MNSILVDLYTGNLNISEREPLSSPLRKLYLKEYNKLKEQFDCLLNEKEKLLLNELLEAKNSEMGVSDIGAFISGFRLAVLLMIEVLYSKRHLKTVQASRQNRPENTSPFILCYISLIAGQLSFN